MNKVTIDRETGEVVIRASLEEAMAIEAVLASFDGNSKVNMLIHAVWNSLDDIRSDLMRNSPSAVPLAVRHMRGHQTCLCPKEDR